MKREMIKKMINEEEKEKKNELRGKENKNE